MCAALGGRAAEDVIFGSISTGALSDLEKITKQAYASVAIFGLNDKIGNISYYDSSGNADYNFTKPYSERTAQTIDEEVKKMIDEAYVRTLDLLRNNRAQLDKLASTLLEKEVIYKEDLENIFGKRKWEKDELLAQENKSDSPINNEITNGTAVPNLENDTPPMTMPMEATNGSNNG